MFRGAKMPYKSMKKPCAYPGCPVLVDPGQRYCEEHQKRIQREYDRERGSAASRGYDARWRRLRQMYLAANPLCEECLRAGRITPATQVHHKDGNPNNSAWSNLESLCLECHSRKTAKEQGRWGRGH